MKVYTLRITCLGLFILLSTLFESCSLHDSQSTPAQTTPRITAGKPAFSFDPKQTTSLSLVKADSSTGDHWSAQVQRVPSTPGSFQDSDPWQITSYSNSPSLIDRLANRGWILHFLDTLSTFRADLKMDAPSTPESLAKYGFSPPRYALQWQVQTSETPPKLQTYELQIGSALDFEKNPDGETYAVFPSSKVFYQANGAALVMLSDLKTFLNLRQDTLSTLESDDVNGLEVTSPGKSVYARREGPQWNDKKHHSLNENIDVEGLLNLVTHLRILKFVDSQEEIQKLLPLIRKKNILAVKVVLKDRYSQKDDFKVCKIGSHTYATESSRPGAVFELYPETFDRLSNH
jgi:hypothetical protein